MADGHTIENKGEKRVKVLTEEGLERRIVGQVCDVNKSLLSVRKVCEAGSTVVFKKGHGWIEDDKTGERVWMQEREGMYVVKMWVPKDQGFQRQG